MIRSISVGIVFLLLCLCASSWADERSDAFDLKVELKIDQETVARPHLLVEEGQSASVTVGQYKTTFLLSNAADGKISVETVVYHWDGSVFCRISSAKLLATVGKTATVTDNRSGKTVELSMTIQRK